MKPLRIGCSACFFHADPTRPIFKGKTLLYLEQSLAHWVMSEGALAYLMPALLPDSGVRLKEMVADLDGLVLQGGSDVAPQTYGEMPLRSEWSGDAVRDRYEIDLVEECLRQRKPILGICRGAQLLNVALGGTLYQDIQAQVPGARVHRNWQVYDQLFHEIRIQEGSLLRKLYPGKQLALVNSVHHQGLKALGRGLEVEAAAAEDGVIEAVRLQGEVFAFACQWHPEFQDPADQSLLDCKPILKEFLEAAAQARQV
jgi:putative glutamine amidotransferase